jgi:hypothetical protein
MVEALDDEPLLHAVMVASKDIILQALVLPNRKILARNALEHFSQVDTTSLLEWNHCFTFYNNENGKRRRRTTS